MCLHLAGCVLLSPRTCLARLWQGWPVSRTQWGVLYSEASSPWRHLDKVRAIVCFFYIPVPQWYSGEAAGEEAPVFGRVVINTALVAGAFAHLDCWQLCRCH